MIFLPFSDKEQHGNYRGCDFRSYDRDPDTLLCKAVIVAPLTLLLPGIGFDVDGVFLA